MVKANAGQDRVKGPWLYLNAPEIRRLAPGTISALSEHTKSDLFTLNRPPLVYLSGMPDVLLNSLTQAYREANGRLSSDEETGD